MPARRRDAGARHASRSITQAIELALVAGPARFDAHPDLQEYLAAEEAFHVAPRRARDFLHSLAALAQQNGALARLVHQHPRLNPTQPAILHEVIDRDGGRVWNFLPQPPE